jgi:lysophospholipase L1-like esterase
LGNLRSFGSTVVSLTLAACGPVILVLAVPGAGADEQGPERWEAQIQAFEEQDRANPPPEGEIVFVGSSSIRGWDLRKYFPDLPALNRGFGGSQIPDSTHYADRIIIPYKPALIVLYAGDNDIAAGHSPDQVSADFGRFVAKIEAALPEARVLFISIKPSLQRWHLVEKMREANRLIREQCAQDDHLTYVDIDTPMLAEDGKPRKELFKEDGLHLNAEGYALWTAILKPFLQPSGPGPTPVSVEWPEE